MNKKGLLLLAFLQTSITVQTLQAQDYKPNVVGHATKETLDGLKYLGYYLGSNMRLELSIGKETIKLIAALGFATLGGVLIKNGIEQIHDKEKPKKSDILQLCAGCLIAIGSMVYINIR